MKLNVIKEYRDKVTGELVKAGSVIEVDDKRGKEILSHAGYATEITEDKPKRGKSE